MIGNRLVLLVHPSMAAILENVTLMFEEGVRELGFEPVVASAPPRQPGERAIVLGANLYNLADLENLARNSVIYNVENVDSHLMTDEYARLLKDFHVWDYSSVNTRSLSALLGRAVSVFKPFYVDALTRIPAPEEQDIDVLFYGNRIDRRDAIVGALREKQLNVVAVHDVYGRDLDKLISRAKIVLNIHYYENGCFEIIRVFYLLANRRAVVCEVNPGEHVDGDLKGAITKVPYDRLVDVTENLLRNPVRREVIADAGFRAFRKRTPELLKELLLACESAVVPCAANIGSGKSYDPAVLNIDVSERWRPDIVADITDASLFERTFSSARFGEVRLQRGWFHSITVTDVLEHLSDLVTAMANFLDLLTEGGTLHVSVPYDLSYGAWQDPTHVRAFNERSWLYYCEWAWYLGWTETRFELTSQEFIYSPIGDALARQGIPQDEILRTPRAVDSMTAVLRKCVMSDAEREYARTARGGARA